MRIKIVDPDILRSLLPGSITAWLKSRGWQLEETVEERWFRLGKTIDGELWEVEVPFSAALRGYARRMVELLDTVEAAEQVDQGTLVRSIQQAHTDTVRVRVVSEATRGGRIPVEQGSALYGNSRDLVLAAACAAVEPRAAYPSRKPTQASEYLQGLRYGPPEIGSYVVTIESPVRPELQQTFDGLGDGDEVPFERRVMVTLGRALQAARRAAGAAAVANDISPFVNAVSEGLTANLCDAVAGLLEPFDSARLDVGIAFAHSRPMRSGPVRVVFDGDSAPVLREAARIFKEREPISDFEAEGIVTNLHSDDPAAGGAAVVFCSVDGRSRKVKVALESADYALAIQAHQDRNPISLEGELIRERSGYLLRGARNMRIQAP